MDPPTPHEMPAAFHPHRHQFFTTRPQSVTSAVLDDAHFGRPQSPTVQHVANLRHTGDGVVVLVGLRHLNNEWMDGWMDGWMDE
jgi:hypothetical protein